jgi:hypothetical protein
MVLSKGLIYYTDLRPKSSILEVCQRQLLNASQGLPLVSVSLKPIDFGTNIVLENRERSYPTMLKQIVMALEALDTDVVFFTEHDVLYSRTHFDFVPPTDYIYYYNINNWRWFLNEDFAITYDGLHSLSGLCCNRKLALKHFTDRLNYVEAKGWDKQRAREPRWGRVMGYEPGTKPRRRGGFTDETFEVWRSPECNVDIRHKNTFSAPKVRLEDFKHTPTNWRQVHRDDIPGWDLKTLFNL